MLKANYFFSGLGLLLFAAIATPQVRALQAEPGAGSRRAGVRNSGTVPPLTGRRPSTTSTMTAEENRFLDLLNRERSGDRPVAVGPPDPPAIHQVLPQLDEQERVAVGLAGEQVDGRRQSRPHRVPGGGGDEGDDAVGVEAGQ